MIAGFTFTFSSFFESAVTLFVEHCDFWNEIVVVFFF